MSSDRRQGEPLSSADLDILEGIALPDSLNDLFRALAAGARGPWKGESVLVGGDPVDVVVVARGGLVEVHEYAAEWVAGHRLQMATVPFTCFDADGAQLAAVAEAVAGARRRRARRYYRCRECGGRFPPEHRSGSICHGCMEQGGIVF